MVIDPQQFLVQGLASLFGGLLGVSLGAWLTGLYKTNGELTGRSEMIDAILSEVRGTAKATELSKIAARAEGINEIVNEVARTTNASEGAKIATRLERLDQILPEVRAVTETQKRIEASIVGGEWDRYWRLNQMRDAYGRLIGALYGLQEESYFLPERTPDSEAFRDAYDRFLKHASEFRVAAALTRIFAGERATLALQEYEHRVEVRRRVGVLDFTKQGQPALTELAHLHDELLEAAREDLHVYTGLSSSRVHKSCRPCEN
jgi:hypothetical protein